MKHILIAIFCFSSAALHAQRAYKPDHQELIQSYSRAAMLDTTAYRKITRSNVRANWNPDKQSFWYRVNLSGSTYEYILVDAAENKKSKAFDQQKLTDALNKVTGKNIKPEKLLVEDLVFDISRQPTMVMADKKWYKWDQTANTLSIDTAYGKNAARGPERFRRNFNFEQRPVESPDRKFKAAISGGNIYVSNATTKDSVQFTTDGTLAKPYARVSWSPDSKTFVAYKTDPKEVKEVYYLLSSVPGTTRAELKSQKYMQPGEEFTSYEMYLFNVSNKSAKKAAVEKIDFFGAPELHWRKGDNTYFTYEKRDRGHQRFRVIEVNTKTAASRNIIDEKTNTFIYEQRIFTEYLPDTHEIVWCTEKDGYRHLYLIDELTGKEKSRITKGNWVVRNIDSVDVKKRQVWFRASGMNPVEDPYNIHYYRINFDGKQLVNLTPAIGNHTATFSPDKSYFVDTYSQVNVPPVTTLNKTLDGKKTMDVEKADVSEFASTGIALPEVFVAKARDGKADIWGIMCRPSTLDSTKTYPVIEYIYAGPHDSFVPKTFTPYSEMQSIAELGFIVIQCDGMGTANRSKAFHDVCWKNLGDAGFEDRILWIKALGQKHKYVNTTKVGIYGTSAGGQNAGGAVLFHPEFYTSAVAACGCHDNRIDKQWWNEQWMGYPVGPHYDAQSNITNAAKLKGNLMLLVGEADTNVPPESTYRFADALIRAGKTFELIMVPNLGHSDGGVFGKNKKRDFFVKTLLEVDPPNRNGGELSKN